MVQTELVGEMRWALNRKLCAEFIPELANADRIPTFMGEFRQNEAKTHLNLSQQQRHSQGILFFTTLVIHSSAAESNRSALTLK